VRELAGVLLSTESKVGVIVLLTGVDVPCLIKQPTAAEDSYGCSTLGAKVREFCAACCLASYIRHLGPELRGHGQPDSPVPGYSRREVVEDVVALLDILGVRKAHLSVSSIVDPGRSD
jgi:hypothetical protein